MSEARIGRGKSEQDLPEPAGKSCSGFRQACCARGSEAAAGLQGLEEGSE